MCIPYQLSGRPRELPASEDVEMEVPHALPGEVPVVHDEPEVAGISGPGRDSTDDAQEVPTQRFVPELGQLWDMLSGHHEHVERGRRVDVVEGDGTLVLVHDPGGDLTRDDPADHASGHVGTIAA